MDQKVGIPPGDSDALSAVASATLPGPAEDVIWESLHKFLYSDDPGRGTLDAEISRLSGKHGDGVFSELLFMLSHLRFTPEEARGHWRRILEHRTKMKQEPGSDVDLRVALVSYFVEVDRQLENPMIIELKQFEQTRASAYNDDLTGLHNYRMFREYLARETERAQRYHAPMSLVMIDVDDFKFYNDVNGHEAGNEVLTKVAELLTELLRKVDLAARYGGEEFALILPSTPKTGALLVAERARARVERHQFTHGAKQPGGKVTVSMGIATCPADARDVDQLVRCADRAMYTAKARGKNQVSLYGECRRSYRRMNATLDGKFCTLAAEHLPLTTVNVSEGGILFLVDKKLPIGSLVSVDLNIDDGREIRTSGRVTRVEQMASGEMQTAIRIVEIDRLDQMRLSEYIQSIEAPDEDE